MTGLSNISNSLSNLFWRLQALKGCLKRGTFGFLFIFLSTLLLSYFGSPIYKFTSFTVLKNRTEISKNAQEEGRFFALKKGLGKF
jgi:hypothetical protein